MVKPDIGISEGPNRASKAVVALLTMVAVIGAVALWFVQRRIEDANVRRSEIQLRESLAEEVARTISQEPAVANVRFALSKTNHGFAVKLANTGESNLLVVAPDFMHSLSLHFYDSKGNQIDLRNGAILDAVQRDPSWRNTYGYNSLVPLGPGQTLTAGMSFDSLDDEYDYWRASFVVVRYIPAADVADAERKMCDLVTVSLPSNLVKVD